MGLPFLCIYICIITEKIFPSLGVSLFYPLAGLICPLTVRRKYSSLHLVRLRLPTCSFRGLVYGVLRNCRFIIFVVGVEFGIHRFFNSFALELLKSQKSFLLFILL
jgi:hypothetical protein